MQWTGDLIETIVSLRNKESASVIAARYGVTRHAIIGLWWRYRQKHGVEPMKAGTRSSKAAPKTEKAVVLRTPREPKKVVRPVTKQAALIAARPSEIVCEPICFMDAKPHHCRFVIGKCSDGLALFCGSAVEADRSWCPGHARIVFAPTRLTEDLKEVA